MAYLIGTLILPTIFGIIAGLAWTFALGKNLLNGTLYGAVIGIILGVLFYLMSKAARSGGNLNKKETTVVSGSMLFMLFVLSIIAALITWIVRLIFF